MHLREETTIQLYLFNFKTMDSNSVLSFLVGPFNLISCPRRHLSCTSGLYQRIALTLA